MQEDFRESIISSTYILEEKEVYIQVALPHPAKPYEVAGESFPQRFFLL